jgi:hypothetical protein
MRTEELRELDRWTAEHVMGLGLSDDPDRFTAEARPKFYVSKVDCLISRTYLVKSAPTETPFGQSWRKFSPTTDPAAAMEVLKKCGQNNPLEVFQIKKGKNIGLWCVQTYIGPENFGLVQGMATTTELAICLFAKKLFPK